MTLTRNPGAPNEVEVSDTYPEDTPPGTIARMMYDKLEDEVE